MDTVELIPSDEDFYLLLKTLCKTLSDLDTYVQNFGIDKNDVAVLRLKQELTLQQQLSKVTSLQELDSLVQKGELNEHCSAVKQRRTEIVSDVTCMHCSKQLA